MMTATGQSRSIAQELRVCLNLAVPLATAQLAQMATGFVDTVMMGRLGSEVIAGGGLGAMTFNFLLMVCGSTVSAVSPLVAEAFGGHQGQRIQRIFWQGLGLAVLLATVCMGVIALTPWWLPHLGGDSQTLSLTQHYLGVVMWGSLPALIFVALRSFVAALGQTRLVMLVVLLGTGVNIIGNYGLSLGKWGLPALGLTGIALASVLSFGVMMTVLGGYVLWQADYRRLQLFSQLPQWHPQEFGELLRVGLPIGGLAAVEGGMFTVTTYLMAYFGTVTLAAHQIALQTAALTFMVPMGISMAATVRVGQLLGQKDLATARRAGLIAIALGGAFMAGMALVMWLAPTAIVSLYIDTTDPANQAVVAMAEALLGVAAVFQLVDGIQVTAAGALRGLKDTRVPLIIGVLAYWGIGAGSGLILARYLKLGGVGLWWGLATGLLFAAIILTWRFISLLSAATVPSRRLG